MWGWISEDQEPNISLIRGRKVWTFQRDTAEHGGVPHSSGLQKCRSEGRRLRKTGLGK